jgi:choline monooxygenase
MNAATAPRVLTEFPPGAYIDPAFRAREDDWIFSRQWVHIAAGHELSEAGSVFVTTVAGLPIFAARQRSGSVLAFHNACRHRGCRLVSGSGPKRASLACPFHGWVYELDGRLRRTPFWDPGDATAAPSFEPARHGLKPVRTATWCDQVFVCLSDEAPPFEQHIAPLARYWAEYDLSRLGYGIHGTFEVEANWKLVVENFLDTYHLPCVHPQMGGVEKAKDYAPVDEDQTVFGIRYLSGGLNRNIGDLGLPIFPNLSERGRRSKDVIMLFPNTLLELAPEHVLFIRLEPKAMDLTRETLSFYFVDEGATAEEHAEQRRGALQGWTRLNEQDFAVLRESQAAAGSPGARDLSELSPFWEESGGIFRWRVALELGLIPA